MPTYRVPIDYDGAANSPAYLPDAPDESHTVNISTYSYRTNTVTITTSFIWEDRPDEVEVVHEDNVRELDDGEVETEADDETESDDGDEHVCDECGKAFDSRMALVGHSNAHTDE